MITKAAKIFVTDTRIVQPSIVQPEFSSFAPSFGWA